MDASDIPEFVPVRAAAERTGQSLWTVKNHAIAGTIPAIKLGRLWMIPVSYLRQLEHDAYDRVRSDGAS
jgi:hypothetical protein